MVGLFEGVGVREIKEVFTQMGGDEGQTTQLLMKSLNDKQKQSKEMWKELQRSRGGELEDSEEESDEEWLWQNSEKRMEKELWKKKERVMERGRKGTEDKPWEALSTDEGKGLEKNVPYGERDEKDCYCHIKHRRFVK